jgi:hypothetical protein
MMAPLLLGATQVILTLVPTYVTVGEFIWDGEVAHRADTIELAGLSPNTFLAVTLN